MKRIKDKVSIDLISVIIGISPFLTGMLSLWSCYLIAIVCIVGIIYKAKKNKKVILPKGKNIIFIGIYVFTALIVNFYAIDKGMNIMYFFKNLTIILFIILYMQYDYNDEKKENILNVISLSGCISVVISLFLLSNDNIFFNGRLQGVFCYANSYGLFLLVGLMCLLCNKKLDKYEYIKIAILIIGIILTNSRAVLLITLFAFICMIIINKKNAKKFLIIMLLSFLIFFTINTVFNLEKRIDKDMLESGEFITRLLYYKDAIDMIKTNPWGYGYNGWKYEQVEIQTGVYDTKYVHNSVLQVALDVGIIPMICLAILLISTILDKKQSWRNRLLIILILGHSLIDIDMEFIIYIYILVLMIDFKKFEYNNTNNINIMYGILGVLCMVYSVLFISTCCFENNNYDMAYTILPFYTEALEEELYTTTDYDKQLILANKIIKLNENVSGVYEAITNELKRNNKYDEALKYEKKRLNLNKYAMINYIYYVEYLSSAINYYQKEGDREKILQYMNEVSEVEIKINDVINNTNPLCYKTQHIPNLNMPTEMKQYIEKIKNISENYRVSH